MSKIKAIIAKGFAVSTICTLFSRISGFARDIIFAGIWGTGPVISAFLLAFTIPNMFRRLLGEGALSEVFIPIYNEKLTKDGKESAFEFLNQILSLLILALSLLTIPGIIISYILMGVFTDGGLYQYASYAMAWLFPYMIFICLCGFLSGVLHSFQKFTIPALLPIVLNTFFIATSLYIGSSITDEKLQLKILCIAIVISGIVQLVILVPGLYKLGWRFKPLIYKATTESRKLLKNFIPGLFSAGLYQINLVCDRLFAAWLGAYAVSSLYYSERLVYLPVGLFAVSIATVCLPLMSKAFAENKIGDVTESIFFSIKILNILCLPCVAVLCISGKEIISILFERGAFTADSLNDCYGALLFYSFGIPAYAIIKILRSAFFSQQDVKTPLKVSGVCFVLNIVLNLCLIGSMEQKGLALATAISSTVNCLILFYILFKRFEGQSAQFKSLAITTGKQLLAVGIFIVFLLIMKDLSLNPIPSLIISLTTASLIYFLSLIFLSKKETFAVVATVKKKLGF